MLNDILVYSVCLGVLVLITTGIAFRIFLEWQRPGARTLGFMLLAMAVWAGFYLLEISVTSFPLKVISHKILYLGMILSGPLWLGFALRYTGQSEWWSQGGRISILIIPGVIAFLLGIANESHQLIWASVEMPVGNGFGPLQLTYGPGFWLYTAVTYIFISLGMYLYITTHLRAPKIFRSQTGLMLTAALVTLTTNAIFLTGILPSNIDPTPLAFTLAAPLFAIGFLRFGLFNLFPVAAPIIIENLRDAVIVVDGQDRVTNLNYAGQEWLGIQDEPLGKSIFEILPKPDLFKEKWEIPNAKVKLGLGENSQRLWYEATITQLYKSKNTLIGRVIVIHDSTQEQELLETELRRSAQLGLLEEVGRQIADSFDEREIFQRSIDAVVDRFGYAEAAISRLGNDNMLEVIAIAGTQDFGYRHGFKQEVGKGIIGHTAKIQKTYIANNVASDPHYFSNEEHHGSAIAVAILNEGKTLGVLYVESAESNVFNQDDTQTLETVANQISASVQRARLFNSTQEHLRVLSTMQTISHVVSASLDLEKIFEAVVQVLKKTFGYTHISIYILKDEYLHFGAQSGYPDERVIRKFHLSQGVHGQTVKTRQAQFIQDVTKEPIYLPADNGIVSEICIPLLKDDIVLGTLNVEGDANSLLTQADVEMLITLAGPIALAVDNARLHTKVKEMAMTDAVSGLSNRHAFEENLISEVERSTRLNYPLSLIIFDLDSFKNYNDTWGHPAGDVRLKATAELISKNLRKYDIAARYGGDEFAIILPNTNRENAILFAKRLLTAAEASAPEEMIRGESISGYTLSIGIATFPQDGNTHSDLLIAADHAELVAKQQGKNQIFVAGDLKKI